MLFTVYPIIQSIVIFVMLAFVAALILRLIFNFSDPNPFGTVGRFSYNLKKATDRFVFPAASLLASFRINTRYAPLVTIFISIILGYFLLQIIQNTFFIVDGLAQGIATGNVNWIIGFVLYALISIYILFIFIRFVSSWFVFTRNTFFGFVRRVTDPVLIPVQRLIPPIGMFDISAMLVLLLLGFLQSIVLRVFVS
ncbi:MAG: YggT family protein [Acidobacteria bacterium]|nr:YggT family protein [Acidobacteriota bacterium]MCA1638524.1 YggT family protein [Acidobacteriota bacterium]